MTPIVTIYTKNNCHNCVAAKLLLKAKGTPFVDVGIESNPALLDDLPPGVRQMPQIWVNRQHVGGLAGLRAALEQIGI